MSLETNELAAKALVNKIRKEHGQRAIGKLKKGIRCHYKACPMAWSLPCREALWELPEGTVSFDGHVYDAPEVAVFMRDFDNGKYPHLEIGQSQIRIKKPGDRKLTVLFDPAVDGPMEIEPCPR